MALVDLEMAARVCAIRFEDLNRKVPAMLLHGPSWWGRIRFTFRLLCASADVEYARFQDYFVDHGCPPATHNAAPVSADGKRYESMPGIIGLVTAIARGSSWPPETIWACSPGAAEWYLAGIFTHRGVDMRLKSSHDEEFEAGMRAEREAQLAAKMAAKTAAGDSPE